MIEAPHSIRIIVMKKISVVLASLLLVACASTPKPEVSKDMKPNATNNSTGSPTTSALSSQNVADAALASAANASKANESQAAANQGKSVYFDFDSYSVQPGERDVVAKQATTIKTLNHKAVVLEGNADERGSSAYNLALGSRRAHAVKKTLVAMGIPASQIKTVSLGKEKPRLTCHEEKCWHENRRVDFEVKNISLTQSNPKNHS